MTIYYEGKAIEELTKEELITAIKDLYHRYTGSRETIDRIMELADLECPISRDKDAYKGGD